MTDILIRDVPDDVLAAIDARAKELGLSRVEFIRRRLAQEVPPERTATVADFEWFRETFADLVDDEVMRGAWHRPAG